MTMKVVHFSRPGILAPETELEFDTLYDGKDTFVALSCTYHVEWVSLILMFTTTRKNSKFSNGVTPVDW